MGLPDRTLQLAKELAEDPEKCKRYVDEAMQNMRSMPDAAPDLAVATSLVLNQAGLQQEALLLYREAARLAPDSQKAQCKLANQLIVMAGYDEAASIIQQHRQINPDDADWMLAEGSLKFVTGQLHSALKLLGEYFGNNSVPPDEGEDLVRMLTMCGTKVHNDALAMLRDRRYADSLGLLMPIVDYIPPRPDTHKLLWSASRAIASAYGCLDERAQAETWLRRCTELDPSDGDTWGMLGHVMCEQGKTTEAMQAYEEALRRGVGDMEAGIRRKLEGLKSQVSGEPPVVPTSTGGSPTAKGGAGCSVVTTLLLALACTVWCLVR